MTDFHRECLGRECQKNPAVWFGRGRMVTTGKSDPTITDVSIVAAVYSAGIQWIPSVCTILNKVLLRKSELPKIHSLG